MCVKSESQCILWLPSMSVPQVSEEFPFIIKNSEWKGQGLSPFHPAWWKGCVSAFCLRLEAELNFPCRWHDLWLPGLRPAVTFHLPFKPGSEKGTGQTLPEEGRQQGSSKNLGHSGIPHGSAPLGTKATSLKLRRDCNSVRWLEGTCVTGSGQRKRATGVTIWTVALSSAAQAQH